MAGSAQRASGQVSGGMRIDDHAFFGGKAPAGQVFPMGCKMKQEMSAGGAGELPKYVDSSDRIKASQEMAKGKIKGNQGKLPEHRN